jgi:hypothetical protein
MQAIEESVAIHTERFGPEDGQMATDLAWKAAIEARTGDLAAAERDAHLALRLIDGGALAVRPSVSYLRTVIGTVFMAAGQLNEASTQMLRAESELRANHHEGVYLGLTLDALCDLSRRQTDTAHAVERGAQGVAILTATLGPRHAATAIARAHAGAARWAAGERAAAESLMRSGLAELENQFPSDHPDVRAVRLLLERALASAPKS